MSDAAARTVPADEFDVPIIVFWRRPAPTRTIYWSPILSRGNVAPQMTRDRHAVAATGIEH